MSEWGDAHSIPIAKLTHVLLQHPLELANYIDQKLRSYQNSYHVVVALTLSSLGFEGGKEVERYVDRINLEERQAL